MDLARGAERDGWSGGGLVGGSREHRLGGDGVEATEKQRGVIRPIVAYMEK